MLQCALTQAKITRIFLKKRGIEEVAEESSRNLVRQGRPIALAISFRALPVLREFIFSLAQTCLQSHKTEFNRIESRPGKQLKLFAGGQGRSVLAAGNSKLRHHTQHSLRLLFFTDLFLFVCASAPLLSVCGFEAELVCAAS